MDTIHELFKIDFVYLFISICTILFGIKTIYTLFEWVVNKMGIETRFMRQKREDRELLMKTSESLSELHKKHENVAIQSDKHDEEIRQDLSKFMNEMRVSISQTQDEIKQFSENRIHDREQSIRIQKELTEAQNTLAKAISSISEKIDNMQSITDSRFKESEEKNNKRIRAELKDKISQSYRYYHSIGQINDMEFEALKDLINEYESANGENSFVHSIVQKEMYTWKKVETKLIKNNDGG